jgi:hypothetical protein
MNVSPSRTRFFSKYVSGSKPLNSPAMVVAWSEVSNLVMAAIPLLPALSADQLLAVSRPQGLIAPTPVTTTLRMATL